MSVNTNPEDYTALEPDFELDMANIAPDYYAELVDAGLSPATAQSVAVSLEDEQLDELLNVLQSAEVPMHNSEEGIYIPCDERLRDYFWRKVDSRIDNPATNENSHADVIVYLISKL